MEIAVKDGSGTLAQLLYVRAANPTFAVSVCRHLPQARRRGFSKFRNARMTTADLLFRCVKVSRSILQLVVVAGFGGLAIGRNLHFEDTDDFAVALISFL